MKRYGKRDTNQKEIFQALRDAYISVHDTASLGDGFPDGVAAGVHRKTGQELTALLEVKTEDGKLTPAEEKFIASWRGTVHIVRTPAEALRVFGIEV